MEFESDESDSDEFNNPEWEGEELDTAWIEEFITNEKLYKPFYKDKVTNIRTIFIYINANNEIIYSKKFRLMIKDETFTKDQLITILKRNMLYNNNKFYPLYLLKFNITLDQDDVKKFNIEPQKFNFLNQVEYVHDILWKKTINFFHPLNSIYLIMKIRTPKINNGTKKIYITSKKKRKKTRRKYI